MITNPESENKLPMERVLYEVKKIIVGQDHLLERLVVALLARGHILVEGVPGLAKTMAIKTLAEALSGEFKRRLMRDTPWWIPLRLRDSIDSSLTLVGTKISRLMTLGLFGAAIAAREPDHGHQQKRRPGHAWSGVQAL